MTTITATAAVTAAATATGFESGLYELVQLSG